jgi:shikimate kinase
MNVVLLGFRGSGKTSVGRALAERLGVELIDTDALVVLRAGMTIREIFETSGEPHFRDLEAAVLEDALRWLGERVIATGGGIVLRETNRVLLARSGCHRIYLRCDPSVLHQRITQDAATASSRPALTTLGGSLEEVRQLVAQREPLYRSVMSREVDVTALDVPSIVAELLGYNSD